MLEDKLDANVEIGSVRLHPFNAVTIKDVAIIDKHPCPDRYGRGTGPLDTVAWIGRLTATLSPGTVLGSQGIHLGKVEARDLLVQMAIEPDSLYGLNLTRVFRLGGGDDSPMTLDSLFFIHKLDVQNVRFRMVNFHPRPSFREHGINFEDMDVTVNLKADDLSFHGGRCHGIVRSMKVREKCGYEILDLSGSFHVGMGHTNISDVRMRDNRGSDIHLPKLDFNYPGNPSAWGNFVEEVELDADFARSRLAFRSIAAYGADIFETCPLTIYILGGTFKGPVADFRVSDVELLTLDGEAGARANVSIKGIPKTDKMLIDGHIGDIFLTSSSLQGILADVGSKASVSRFAPGVRFHGEASMKGLLSDFNATAALRSSIGSVRLDGSSTGITKSGVSPEFKANVSTNSLDLGKLLGIKDLGRCTMTGRGGIRTGSPLLARLETADISSLEFKGYTYNDIHAEARLRGDELQARLISNDSNAEASLNASWDIKRQRGKVNADIAMIDLAALGFDKRGGRSRISCKINGEQGLVDGEPGYIGIRNLILQGNDGDYEIGDVEIQSRSTPDHLTIALNSSVLDAKYDGTPELGKLIEDFRQVTVNRHIPAYFDPHGEMPEGPLRTEGCSLSAVFHETAPLAAFLLPGLKIDNGTALNLELDANGSLIGYVIATGVGYGNILAQDLNLAVDNMDGDLDCTVSANMLRVGDIPIDNASFGAKAAADMLTLALDYESAEMQGGGSEIYIDAAFSRDQRDSLRIDMMTLPSQINVKGRKWDLGEAIVTLESGSARASGLSLYCDDQSIEIDGGVSPGGRDTLSVRMNRFDLSLINAFTGGGRYALGGTADGTLTLLSPIPDKMGLFASLGLSGISLGGTPAGDFDVHSDWDDKNGLINFKVDNFNSGVRTMALTGNYSTKGKSIDGTVEFDRQPAVVLTPVLDDYIKELGGTLSGSVKVSGPLNSLKLASEDVRLGKVRGRVTYTNVAYTLDGTVSIHDNKVRFNNIGITDDYSGLGVLTGIFDLGKMKDFSMDANLQMQGLKAIDNRNLDKTRIGVFGDIAATGNGRIKGPVNALSLDAVVSTSGPGYVSVPLSSTSSASGSDLLTFKEPVMEGLAETGSEQVQRSSGGQFTAHARVSVSPEVTASIEIDKESGHMLTAGGTGDVTVDLNTARNKLKLNGDYLIDKGKYLFNIPGIVSKEFDIREGSSLKFNGDVLESTMDVKAVHNVKTSLATLVADSTAVSSRRNVECGLNITGKLRSPEVKFSIDVPDLDPGTRMQVESALSTEDKIQKQFVALLLFGTFIPDERAGVVNGTNMLYSNVGEIVAGQLNNILQKLDIPLDFGFGYQQDNIGTDIFDVAVSTQLFNNRLVVGGSLGNRRYSTSKSSNGDVVGDLDIELKLDKSGELRFKLFSHSADEFTSSLDYSQRNGIGLSYQKEFNKVLDFLRQLFSNREQRAENALAETERRKKVKLIEIE